jgi:hypothetical protein
VKKSLKEQKHSIPPTRDKVQEGAKNRKQLFFASLCALASLREIVYFFTASQAVGGECKRRSSSPVGAKECADVFFRPSRAQAPRGRMPLFPQLALWATIFRPLHGLISVTHYRECFDRLETLCRMSDSYQRLESTKRWL